MGPQRTLAVVSFNLQSHHLHLRHHHQTLNHPPVTALSPLLDRDLSICPVDKSAPQGSVAEAGEEEED